MEESDIFTMEKRKNVQGLIEALADSNTLIRTLAAESLGKLADPQAVDRLISAAGDADEDVRISAIVALGKLKDRRAVRTLVSAMADRNAEVRKWTTVALGRLGDPATVECLKTALYDEDEIVRGKAVEALQAMGVAFEEQASESLAMAALKAKALDGLETIILEDKDPSKRQKALQEFLRRDVAVEVLVLTRIVLKTEDAAVREGALQRLMERGNSARARAIIIAAREELNAEERMRAAESLLRLGL